MADWVALGGGNSGIVGDPAHTYGFHLGANAVPSSDYSRWRDPNGSDGPYVDWDYACAGDFSHGNNSSLRAYHVDVLNRLMAGQFPMICEFIGKPWADKPVYYWARWNGVGTLQKYTGSGHDTWSHISWYRSKVDQRAYLWTQGATVSDSQAVQATNVRNEALATGALTYETKWSSKTPHNTETHWQGTQVASLVEAVARIEVVLAELKAAIAAITPDGTMTVSGGELTIKGDVTGTLVLNDATLE